MELFGTITIIPVSLTSIFLGWCKARGGDSASWQGRENLREGNVSVRELQTVIYSEVSGVRVEELQ